MELKEYIQNGIKKERAIYDEIQIYNYNYFKITERKLKLI